MIAPDLAEKWGVIEALPREGDYDLLLISPECHAVLSVGRSPRGSRCLILRLPDGSDFEFVPAQGDRLSLYPIREKNFVILALEDFNYCDLFDDLIVDTLVHIMWNDVGRQQWTVLITMRDIGRIISIDFPI